MNKEILYFLTAVYWGVLQMVILTIVLAVFCGIALGFLGAMGLIAGPPFWITDGVIITSAFLVSWRQTSILKVRDNVYI